MKKTVIAAALASTVFSGAAMAWTINGTGGNIELGGNIQVTPYSTPWEVEVGAPATALDANITKGTKTVMIPVTKAIPVLGIRTASKDSFRGRAGINPHINYNGVVQVDNFVNGVTSITLPVMDADNPTTQIGAMETKFTAAVLNSYIIDGASSGSAYTAYSDSASRAWWGGLGKNAASVAKEGEVTGLLTALNPDYLANYNTNKSTTIGGPNFATYTNTTFLISAVYGAGIQSGSSIKLTLTNPAANNAIKWKASLPVTISYQ